MSHETLLVQRDGTVATVTLNRPAAKNALSPAMADELTAVTTELAHDDAIHAVLLTGAGGN